ncbi:hypothetical protein AMAG_04560 [Allomyces macrogynus ATCC 38327]|uniref:P-loop containing nucleoside triphosphate hydrolase protein n=1 Tax=Allomyces macrogynus (strain ATCC 38327) TaxID=578462 RepID=A0A0L0S5K6_ALLM3|nr:hypothetical protein AMAG_04560 [Allomyces macrogynus ATCC 38327]|eukprot:KNE57701.1 hypothetical protein AMAG_04560 [Allomyces macrogynus ATCC 38327]
MVGTDQAGNGHDQPAAPAAGGAPEAIPLIPATKNAATAQQLPTLDDLPPPALDAASWFSKMFFFWVSPLIRHGGSITEQHLNALQPDDQAAVLVGWLGREWERELQKKKPSLPRAIARAFRKQIFWSGFYAFIEIFTKIGEAVFLGLLVERFQSKSSNAAETPGLGYLWAILLALVTAAHGLLHHHFFFVGMRLGVQIRVALTGLIYRKTMHLAAGAGPSAGVIVNLVSNDAATMEPTALFMHYVWIAAIEVVVCAWLLYERLSWPSLLGLILVALMVPMQHTFATQFRKRRRATVGWRDSRIRLMADLLTGINVVKFNAWKDPFITEIDGIRHHEMKSLLKAGLTDACNEASFFVFPSLISLIVYGTCYAARIPLVPADVFSSVMLFNLLRQDLTNFVPRAIKSLTEARVTIDRIGSFLKANEIPELTTDSENTVDPTESAPDVIVHPSQFAWDQTQPFTLDLAHTFPAGSLTAVIGRVGAGKSSLASALLGEMPLVSGQGVACVDAHGRAARIAYAPQTAWIMAGTVLENITFGAPLDATRLQTVVAQCALERDLAQWPNGLHTVVGERGVALSGGQRARVGLARVLYAQAKVLVLDDPLSAVDTRVARRIFAALRALENTTTVLITHQLQFVRECDAMVVMEAGKLVAAGHWDELVQQQRETGKASDQALGWMSVLLEHEAAVHVDDVDVEDEPPASKGEISEEPSPDAIAVDAKGGPSAGLAKETSAVGTISWSTFVRFLITPNPSWMLLCCALLVVGGQAISTATDWTLARWVSKPVNVQLDDPYYFHLFLALVMVTLVLGVMRASGVYYLLLRSSESISRVMLRKVLDAPMAWFAANHSGTVLNRFSRDATIVDEQLPNVFYNVMQSLFVTVGVVVIVIMVLPWVALSLPPLLLIFVLLRRWYIGSSRQVKRIESATRSPVYAHLSESLEGLAVIRALRAQGNFTKAFMQQIDTNTRAVFAQCVLGRWLGLRLDLLSALFMAIAAIAAVAVANSGGLPPALAGLALSQILTLTGVLQWMVRQSVETEVMFVSVQRMLEYEAITGESDHPARALPPPNWPTAGNLDIKHMALQYPTSPRPVLHDWNVSLRAGERIGLVGRSGAGKTSFFQALFRMYDYTGTMTLDGIDTSTLTVEPLRRALAMIPQEAFLFRGTLRFNLDPFGEYPDADLWQALARVELKGVVDQLDGKLDAKVEDGGSNFSLGQRQLLCLARALLKRAKVLVLDEATANIDYKTDVLIQHAIKAEFKDALILTIAHRLRTVLDYDRLLVLDAGRVVECGHAWELLQNRDGLLSRMVADTGADAARQLTEIARVAWEEKQRQGRAGADQQL